MARQKIIPSASGTTGVFGTTGVSPVARMSRHPTDRRDACRTRRAFTLVELMIVISLIVLVLTMSLPTLIGLFRAGADAQAANLASSYLTAARGLAIRNSKYAGVKVQIGAPGSVVGNGACYITIVEWDGNTFGSADGYAPLRLPGNMCLGLVDPITVTGSGFNPTAVNDPAVFCSFTILFSPSGKVSRLADGHNIIYRNGDPLFNSNDANMWIWDYTVSGGTVGKAGGTAMTLFDYGLYTAQPDAAAKAAYLNKNGQFLPVNVLTGQLFPRK